MKSLHDVDTETYEKKEDSESGIVVYIKANILPNNEDFKRYKTEYINDLIDSYRHYGKQNGEFQKLNTIL